MINVAQSRTHSSNNEYGTGTGRYGTLMVPYGTLWYLARTLKIILNRHQYKWYDMVRYGSMP